MDTTWTNMRQVVADRVLNRHLRDLEDQQVAMGMTSKQHLRLMDRDLIRELPLPASKLHTPLPPPSSHATRSTKHHTPSPPSNPTGELQGNPAIMPSDIPDDRPPSRDGARILDMMTETLQSVSLMEQQRPTLYLNGPEGGRGRRGGEGGGGEEEKGGGAAAGRGGRKEGGSKPHGSLKLAPPKQDTTLPQPSKSKQKKGPAPPPLDLRGPFLERGETFIKTNKYQLLSLDASGEALAASLTSGSQFPRPITSATKATKARRSSLASQHELHKPTVPQPRRRSVHVAIPSEEDTAASPLQGSPQRRRSIHVEFYDEIDTGLRKEDGGFTHHNLTLPLHLLHDDSSDINDDDDGEEGEEGKGEGGGGEEGGKEEEKEEEKEGEGEKDEGESWDDVKNCHYIRGYDPPHMRMPTDSIKFVFGEEPDAPDEPR